MFVEPDNDGRLVVDQMNDEFVRLRLVSDALNAQHFIGAEQARAAAAQLEAAADRVDTDDE